MLNFHFFVLTFFNGVSVGPAVCHGPGAISMKEEWVQRAPPHSHTQTSYAGTRDNTRPATIVVARGFLSPKLVFWAAFYCCGGKG